ncbi:precorrin-3B synthase [Rhodospirillales bacterium URHD0017]|nr:precorrin-3B synthase [Rhodospirillales bacterium URHD0017]
MNAVTDVKGWCPGILRPMASGDGLIVRVRPRGGAFSLETAATLADLAARLGNGHIDLTRRANLQLRGLTEDRLPELRAELATLGLLDPDTVTEAVRNVMVAPLAGLDPSQAFDVRPVARAIDDALTSDKRLHALPGKFGLLVDGGGAISIACERTDVGLAAVGDAFAFGLDTARGTRWLGMVPPAQAAEAAIAAAHGYLAVATRGRMRGLDEAAFAQVAAAVRLSPMTGVPAAGGRRLGLLGSAVGIAAPFGRLEADQLRQLVKLAADAGAIDLRLSPWRAVYFGVRKDAGVLVLEEARGAGLIVEENDPVLQVEACPGAPDCKSSSVDARGDARRLAAIAAAHGYRGSIHVSGCGKGCARSLPSDLVLAGKAGAYRLIRKATTRGPVERMVDADEFEALFQHD